ncbi:hypothetical protein OBBRIDRAFT_115510 [Obba rivulosa]|uniref:DUF6533 domain-containing protein n=1 Tax=Obba rivulosa TaxID=1052685 RepID=A0A8E2ATF1_9APHY|nr:hypothetical protein OBBRIDRAFT_115510 [Obba rivulosa]
MSALNVPTSETLNILVSHGVTVNAVTREHLLCGQRCTTESAFVVAGLTALVYDHILTFGDEVTLIWRGRFGLVSVIFLFNRYLIPFVLMIDVYESFGVSTGSVLFCKIWTVLQSYLTIVSFMSIHTIVAWRLYVLHMGLRWIGRLLWIAGVLYAASSTTIITAALVRMIADLHPVAHQCVGEIPSFLWTAWLPSIVFESLLFGLTVQAMLKQERRHSLNPLSLLLYRDGMLYFVAVTFCTLFSLLVWALAGPTFLGLARYFALAMVNIAGSRLVLNLKGFAASRQLSVDQKSALPSSSSSDLTWSNAEDDPSGWHTADGDFDNTSPVGMCSSDIEMYSVEREEQQLGTKLR